MKIVVLDASPLDQNDLDWTPLRELGEVEIHTRTAPDEIIARIAAATAVFTNKVRLDDKVLCAAPHLQFIGEMATGTDNIDLEAARKRGITVCNVPSYSAAFTAQTAWALILECTHRIGAHDAAVKSGRWTNSSDFSFWDGPLLELDGKVLCLVGTGNIGRRVGRIGRALGMKVVSAALRGRNRPESEWERVALNEALNRADFVSLHCPATPQTEKMVDAAFLSQMKRGAFLVNTARGKLIDESDLARALETETIGGYASDVLSVEPPTEENPLLSAPRCILTPHLGWASAESRVRCLATSVENLRAFIAGEAQNVVT